jgi:hypothetical protein
LNCNQSTAPFVIPPSRGTNQDQREFSEYLLAIGDGRHDTHDSLASDFACIPNDLLIPAVEEDMGELINTFGLNVRRIVDHLYGDIGEVGSAAFEYLSVRAILTPLNTDMEASR